MKTQDELNKLKNDYETLKAKLQELSIDELISITGGAYKKDIGSDKNAKVIFNLED